MSKTRIEMETVINFNEAESMAVIYTHNTRWIDHLEKICLENPEIRIRGRIYGDGAREFTVPKGWLKLPKAPRMLSESEKQQRLLRLKRPD